MNILIINGPNLNLLGTREPSIYGSKTYLDLLDSINILSKELFFSFKMVQTNHEGTIIDYLHDAKGKFDGIIINPGAYTHYSYAIYDAILAICLPTIEVHLSDITTREPFRSISVIRPACITSYYGEQFLSYHKAIKYLLEVNHE